VGAGGSLRDMSLECEQGSDRIPTRGWITVIDGNLEVTFCSPTCFDAWFSGEVDNPAQSPAAENEIQVIAQGSRRGRKVVQ
jgi:hypothetical protein